MTDFSKFLDLSSIFVAISGAIFAAFYTEFHSIINSPMPPLYRNRKSYIISVQNIIITKAIPLTIFLVVYIFALLGTAVKLWVGSKFTLSPFDIDPAATLFSITYLLSFYILLMSVIVTWRLLLAWFKAGRGRGSDTRVTLLR